MRIESLTFSFVDNADGATDPTPKKKGRATPVKKSAKHVDIGMFNSSDVGLLEADLL